MIRIRGTVGGYPVALDIELDAQDWTQLGGLVSLQTSSEPEKVSRPVGPEKTRADPFWQLAQQILQQAGTLAGPALLVQLETLTGNTQAAKQLMVRLRHSNEVVVERSSDALLYRWQGSEDK
ncbi:hypothetical protein LX59_00178 [Azomonas agilis]|uniref:Uncharacterized protein n=1 Tax=Azomonas agilis TaxID=116849 RepID=A0A562J2D7_9GAMM|nr:hypothetical protein [Azomonas agilis]TWH77272.1 hypothetical protein LX59_00178 [Azomonas agilis]